MIRAFLALSALAVADALNAASRRLARVVGGRAGDPVEIHFAPWRITEDRLASLYSLHLADLPRTDECEPVAWYVNEPLRIGRIVIARECNYDGGGRTFILDADAEVTYDPSETP